MPAAPRLSPQELLDRLPRTGGGIGDADVLLDARPRERYLYRHLPGALFLPDSERLEAVATGYVGDGAGVYVVVDAERRDEVLQRLAAAGRSPKGYADAEEVEAYLRAYGGPGIKSISFQEVDGRRHYTNTLVLDVRTPDEYAARHIENARNLPFDELAAHVGELPRDQTLLVHCGSGGRAAIAAGLLQAHGLHVVHVGDRFENYRVRTAEEAAPPEA